MNRTHLLLAIAAIAIVGIGVGLLLPNLQSGPITGSFLPMTPAGPWTMTRTPTPTPTPVAPAIEIAGLYSPYLKEDSWGRDVWHWKLYCMMAYDATCLPEGVRLQKVEWSMTGARYDGGTEVCYHRYTIDPPMTDSYTCLSDDTRVGCDSCGPPLCPSAEWTVRPPFTASCTLTTTDGTTYTKSVELIPPSEIGH